MNRATPSQRFSALIVSSLVFLACAEQPVQSAPELSVERPQADTSALAPPELAPAPEVATRFASLVWKGGIPSGVVPLPPQRHGHQRHYLLANEGAGIRVEEFVPGAGRQAHWLSVPMTGSNRRVSHHDAQGALVMVEVFEAGGASLTRRDSAGRRIDLGCARITCERDLEGRSLSETCLTQRGEVVADRHGVAIWRYTRDALGRIIEERSYQADGTPVRPLGARYFGLKHVFDDHGLKIQSLRLDDTGMVLASSMGGFSSEEWDYDDLGRLVEHRFEDERGAVLAGPKGWALETRRYQPSDIGSSVSIRTFDAQGEPTRRSEDGVAYVEERLDASGRLLSRAVFDSSGSPTVEGDARAHKHTYTYDDVGRMTSRAWFDVGGRPTTHPVLGVHAEQRRFDDAGRELSLTYHDGLGHETPGLQGWSTRETTYNATGQVRARDFKSSDGRPIGRALDGVARLFYFYDLEGRLAQVASSDALGNATTRAGGFAREVLEYDAEGRVSARSWFDVIEAPMTHQELGCARETITYDAMGFERERRCFDPEGAPTISSLWDAAGVVYERDPRGLVVKETWRDTEGKAMMTRRGYASKRSHYDARGALLSHALLDAQGRPIFGAEGWAELRFERDAQGRLQRTRRVDTLGNLVPDSEGVAERQVQLASDRTQERFIGPDGQALATAGGVARRERRVDPYGRVISSLSMDVSGLGVRDPDTGCARLEHRYDASGALALRLCYDPQGQLTPSVEGWSIERHTYDARGQRVSIAYRDAADQAVLGKAGWSEEVRTYSDRGWLTGVKHRDLEGGQVGPAMRYQHDRMGRVIRERSEDATGAPLMNAEGWAIKRLDYDTLGRLVSEGYAGSDEVATRRKIQRTRYGVAGRVVERRWLDAKGAVTLGPEGWAIKRFAYDNRGRLVAVRYFDPQDKPGLKGQARSAEVHVRDRLGRLIERRAMAGTDRLVDGFSAGDRSWAIERQRYDARGRRILLATFDLEERPVVGADGQHMVRWTWNDRGQLTYQERFVAPGQSAPGGWARQEHRYDAFSRLSEIHYQDRMGQSASVWNGVGQVRFTYGREGRLATMRWHRASGEPMDANVCFPGAFCARRAIHEARYRYDGAEEAVEMVLYDVRGSERKRLDCREGQCF